MTQWTKAQWLGDDPLRHVLTFLSPADGRRVGDNREIIPRGRVVARFREAEGYVLRGTDHGVVHALATPAGRNGGPKEQ